MKLPWIRLEYVDPPSHNKFYEIWVEEKGSLFVVNFRYGKIGTPGLTGTKTQTPVSVGTAMALFQDLRDEKANKGYKVVDSGSKKSAETSEAKTKVAEEEKPKKGHKPPDEPYRSILM